MSYFRPKTRRRLTILALAALLVLAGGWIVYRIGQHRSAAALAGLRAKAMADYAAGDRQSALGELGDYLARGKQQDTDADALLAYAMCRDSVELPDKRNLIEAVGILSHYHQLRPTDLAAAHTLLEWYGRVHYHAEALALSESLLATAPTDLDARLAKAKALWGLTRLPKALAESELLNRDAPTLLKGQLMTTCLLLAMDRGDEAVRRAEALCDGHPNDARFEMLLGAADVLTGKQADARKWLAAAAARDTADSDFALEQCRFLDAAGLFDNARELLVRTAHSAPTPALVNQLLLRVYQDQGPAATLDLVESLPQENIQSSQALGLECASHYQLPLSHEDQLSSPVYNGDPRNRWRKERLRAHQCLEFLQKFRSDAVARGWAIALAARFEPNPMPVEVGSGTEGGGDPVAAAAAYREALKCDPGNMIVADWLAGSFVKMGERELALAMWRSESGACPNWARPCIEMADTLEILGRPAAALEAAQAGAARAPDSFDAQLTLAGAMVAVMPSGGSASSDAPALAIFERIKARWPGRPETIPLYALSMVRTGQAPAAATVVERALKSDLPVPVVMALANVDVEGKLALDDDIEAKLEQHVGESPAVAIAAARFCTPSDRWLPMTDTTAEAHKKDPAAWSLADNEVLDGDDAEALAEWQKLGDAYPNDVRVQSAAAQSPCRFRDRAFWKRTIDRLHALVGDEGLTWRTEQARWILADPAGRAGNDKNLAEAVTLLQEVCRVAPDDADARHLLGVALRQTGNIPGAIDELTAAEEVAPADWTIIADLSQLLRETGRTDEADAVVHRLAACPMLSPAGRRWADQAMLADRLHSAIATGNLREVEADCRRMLARGQSPDACNDLAYALLLEGRSADRPEALRLARLAVNLVPQRAEYRDTLQRVEAVTK